MSSHSPVFCSTFRAGLFIAGRRRSRIMGSVKAYQDIIIEFLEGYSKIKPVNLPDIEPHVIADREHNHFQLLRIGWQGPQTGFPERDFFGGI